MEFRKPDMGTFLINEQPKQVSVRVILLYSYFGSSYIKAPYFINYDTIQHTIYISILHEEHDQEVDPNNMYDN